MKNNDTPKDIAKELVDDFYKELFENDCTVRDADGCIWPEETKDSAKNLALKNIEIIQQLMENKILIGDYLFFENIKKEIEKQS